MQKIKSSHFVVSRFDGESARNGAAVLAGICQILRVSNTLEISFPASDPPVRKLISVFALFQDSGRLVPHRLPIGNMLRVHRVRGDQHKKRDGLLLSRDKSQAVHALLTSASYTHQLREEFEKAGSSFDYCQCDNVCGLRDRALLPVYRHS